MERDERVIAPCHAHLQLSLPGRQWWRSDQGMTVQQSEDSTSLRFLPAIPAETPRTDEETARAPATERRSQRGAGSHDWMFRRMQKS